MFGYVTVNKPELKIKDFEKYRSYYCGLCHALKDGYGAKGQMTLNYDMTFMIMTLADLYDEPETVVEKRCLVHPFSKHQIRRSEVTDYCADMCVLLAYYKCEDDWNDEHRAKAKMRMNALKSKAKKVIKKYPEKAEVIANALGKLAEYEKTETEELDYVARLFGEVMAEAFAYKKDAFEDTLRRLGFFLGKYIFLLDAYEDVEKDIETGDYNPFKDMFKTLSPNDFDDKVLNLLMLMIGECTDAFERLPLVENADILRNILYSGVWTRYGNKQKERLGANGSL